MAGVKQGLFLRIESLARRRYRLVFLVTIALCLASLFLGRHLTLDGDVLNLVPKNNRVISTFREALADFGSLDYLLLLAEARKGQTVDELQEYVDLLAARLQKVPEIEYVEHRIDTTGPFFSFFRTNQILFLPPAKIDDLEARFTDPAIRAQVKENFRQLTGPSSFLVKQLLEDDPFQVSSLVFKEVLRSKGPLKVDLSSGYFLSKDGGSILIIAKPVKPAQDVAFDKRLMVQVRLAVEEVSKQFEAELKEQAADGASPASDAPELRAPGVDYGGGYIIALDDSDLIMQDMLRNGTLSFVVILALYYFCYRRFGAILYSSVPLMVGQILTLAAAYVFLRHLNSATTGFTAMLMGLGTDFTIVMYARYVEERTRGRSLEDALRLMMGVSAFGVFTGAITSAGTFYAMCVTEYKGLRDFGFLVGTGILFCLAAILFLLPAMIAWNEGRVRKKDVVKRLYLHSFGIERVMAWSTRHPAPVLAVSAVLTLGLGWYAWNVEFTSSVQDLRSQKNRGIMMQETIGRKFEASFTPMMVLCRGADLNGVLETNREANRLLDQFVADGTLRGYESIFNYLPARQDQEQVIAALDAGRDGAFDVARIERTFRQSLLETGFRPETYADYLKSLPAILRPERALSVADLKAAGLGHFIDRYVREDEGGGVKSVTYLFPTAPDAKRFAPPALVKALDRPSRGIEITGVNIASSELKRIFSRDAWRAVILGIILVTVLLWLDFRSLWLTALANVQLILGVIWMLGCMRLLGIKMNFVNAFVTSMILGVGIDYGIHIIHRISQEGLSNFEGLMETGKAVVMAALTNVAGFGTIGLSNYPGLRSMGIVAAIGSVTCLVTALTTLPALLILTKTRVARRAESLQE